ncbi:MAG TPA: IS110 family transposase [Niabella sp.]|jgi:transposase|nr:IS110 family transposase [Niabella sp.]
MAKLVSFDQANSHAAAIDIGSREIFVSPDGIHVRSYATFTAGYRQCIEDLKSDHIERVCMEATGIYWIALYQMLEEAGFEVCLVNPKEVKQVKGRKTDVADACWIQKMFAAGLVRQSYIPKGKFKELRMMIREREDVIIMGSAYVNKMQKALELMNIKLTEVLSQIHGASGIRIIEAIIKGERDKEVLLSLCHQKITENKSEEVKQALEGNYNETWLFLLEQNLKLWKVHQVQLNIIDKKIEDILDTLNENKPEIEAIHKAKPIRHHKPQIEDLNQKLLNIYGVDTNCLPGVTNYSVLKLLGEVGADMSRFPTVKNFVSWCGLAPGHNQSGLRSHRSRMKNQSRAGQIFREIAQSLITSKYIAIGSYMRRLRARKNSKVAIKAGARKIAAAFYNLLTNGSAYIEQGIEKYQEQIMLKEKKTLERLINKYNVKVLDY